MRRKAMSSALAILWGACMLIIGLVNVRYPGYGTDFLKLMSSVDPGFHASRTLGEVVVGTIYGLVDGAILGYVFGSLYLWIAGKPARATEVPGAMPLRRAS